MTPCLAPRRSGIVSPAEILTAVEAAGGDWQILAAADLPHAKPMQALLAFDHFNGHHRAYRAGCPRCEEV